MTASEIFTKICSRALEGVMFHDQMSEYYDFLNLHGYRCCHEYHALCEFEHFQKLHRYFTNHFNRLLEATFTNPHIIPDSWKNHTRQEIDAGTRKRAVREGIIRWADWERDTKKIYEEAIRDLYELGEIAAACEIGKLVLDIDHELKTVERKALTLASVDYDMSHIYNEQQGIHDKCKSEMKRD